MPRLAPVTTQSLPVSPRSIAGQATGMRPAAGPPARLRAPRAVAAVRIARPARGVAGGARARWRRARTAIRAGGAPAPGPPTHVGGVVGRRSGARPALRAAPAAAVAASTAGPRPAEAGSRAATSVLPPRPSSAMHLPRAATAPPAPPQAGRCCGRSSAARRGPGGDAERARPARGRRAARAPDRRLRPHGRRSWPSAPPRLAIGSRPACEQAGRAMAAERPPEDRRARRRRHRVSTRRARRQRGLLRPDGRHGGAARNRVRAPAELVAEPRGRSCLGTAARHLIPLSGLAAQASIPPPRDPAWSGPAARAIARRYLSSPSSSTARNASCGTSIRPTCFIRFLPSFCFSSSLRLR